MKTEVATSEPPAELVSAVRNLKQYCPYRICWGAFKPENPSDTFTGADYDKRKFNANLRAGYAAMGTYPVSSDAVVIRCVGPKLP